MKFGRMVGALAISCLMSSWGFSQPFYVALNGDDTNPGTEALPWRTIQKGASSAIPGSSVFVKAGVYNEKVIINVSGSESAGHVTFRPFGNDTVVVDGSGIAGQNIFEIADKSYIRIAGFTIRNNHIPAGSIPYGGSGIRVIGESHNIVLQHNTIHNITGEGAMGITIYGTSALSPVHDILVDGNTIHDCQPAPSEALTLSGNVTDFQVIYNVVHDVNNIGIDFPGFFGICPDTSLDYPRKGTCRWNSVYNCRDTSAGGFAAGIYVDGGSNILVEGNVVTSNNIGIAVGCEVPGRVADSVRVESNFIFKNDRRGISIGGFQFPDSTGFVRNSSIRFNTLFANDQLVTREGELLIDYASHCFIEGNIFHSSAQNVLVLSNVNVLTNDVRLDYNLWFTPGGDSSNAVFRMNGIAGHEYASFNEYRTAIGMDQHSIFSNPQFVNGSFNAPNLHLLNSSPAINAGDPSFVAMSDQYDIDEEPRAMGSRVDIGADELTITASANVARENPPPAFMLHQNYPNPFNPTTLIRFSVRRPSDKVEVSEMAMLNVYDILGREITQLLHERLPAGLHELRFDASNLPSGVYFYRLIAGGFVQTRRMLLLK
ncbi:MAG: right-handed parallel beta-helix repeat-containing protein [Ignavibacteriae bacterium]|nr:right-handed parallel beta-helix repeat-containing protein [Ignavibacteriota bacterium]